MQIIVYFLLTIFMEVTKSLMRKKGKRTSKLAELGFSLLPFASKMSVSTDQLH